MDVSARLEKAVALREAAEARGDNAEVVRLRAREKRLREMLEEAPLRRRGGVGTVDFDPRLHPRDRLGKFREVLGGLSVGQTARLPGGTTVTRRRGGYTVAAPGGATRNVGGAGDAASVALREPTAATPDALLTPEQLRQRRSSTRRGQTDPEFEGRPSAGPSFDDLKPGDRVRYIPGEFRGRRAEPVWGTVLGRNQIGGLRVDPDHRDLPERGVSREAVVGTERGGRGAATPAQGARGDAGRGPSGRLRNFRAMRTPKLEQVMAAISQQGNDPEAWDAAAEILAERGMSRDVMTPRPGGAAPAGGAAPGRGPQGVQDLAEPERPGQRVGFIRKPTDDQMRAPDAPSTGDAGPVQIVRRVTVSPSQYSAFESDPLKSRPQWFAGAQERRAAGVRNVVEVTDGSRRVWVDTQGYDYARYVAHPVRPNPAEAPRVGGVVAGDAETLAALRRSVERGPGGPAEPGFVARAFGEEQSARSPSGRLRNLRQMNDTKFAQVSAAVDRENNDPEAIDAVRAERERRGGAAAPAQGPEQYAGRAQSALNDAAQGDWAAGLELLYELQDDPEFRDITGEGEWDAVGAQEDAAMGDYDAATDILERLAALGRRGAASPAQKPTRGSDAAAARRANAQRVADAASTGYMADSYGENEWRKVAQFLLGKGHSAHETEAILRSKHMRWADDSEGRGAGNRTGAAAFKRYYANSRNLPGGGDWMAEGRQLALETPSELPGGEGMASPAQRPRRRRGG